MRQITPWSLGVLIFILSIIYLFIFGYAGFSLIVAGGGYSSWDVQASLIAEHRL